MTPVPRDKGAGIVACSANSFMLLPGRVIAPTIGQAAELIAQRIADKGFILLEPVRPFPCRVQHLQEDVWWEYYAKVGKQ